MTPERIAESQNWRKVTEKALTEIQRAQEEGWIVGPARVFLDEGASRWKTRLTVDDLLGALSAAPNLLTSIESLMREREELSKRWESTVAFMERNVGEVIFCEGCGVLMLQAEDGHEALGSEHDPDDLCDYCDNCVALAREGDRQ